MRGPLTGVLFLFWSTVRWRKRPCHLFVCELNSLDSPASLMLRRQLGNLERSICVENTSRWQIGVRLSTQGMLTRKLSLPLSLSLSLFLSLSLSLFPSLSLSLPPLLSDVKVAWQSIKGNEVKRGRRHLVHHVRALMLNRILTDQCIPFLVYTAPCDPYSLLVPLQSFSLSLIYSVFHLLHAQAEQETFIYKSKS